jgi:hypothetical protein
MKGHYYEAPDTFIHYREAVVISGISYPGDCYADSS